MKKIAFLLLSTFIWSGLAWSQDVLTLPAKPGNVTFPHKKHQEKLTNCRNCHEKAPGKIPGFNKELAHKTCKGCHETKMAGPRKCADCHRK